MSTGKTALVVIDAQQEYFAPLGKVVLPGGPDAAAVGGEPVFTKHLPGSFTGTPLEETLREHGVERVVLAGFMTQMCVDTTARQAAHLGFGVTVLADASAAKSVTGPDGAAIDADAVHRTHLGSLNGFLAEIRRTEEL